jgi:Arc-like DNA binding domain
MRVRKDEEIIQVNLRLPRWLHRHLVQEAKKARRPLNSEMVVRLEHSLERLLADKLLERAVAEREEAEGLFKLVTERFGMQPRVYGLLAPEDLIGKPIPEDET